MAKYIRKPETVEARQFFPNRKPWPKGVDCDGICWRVLTRKGHHFMSPGDWVVMDAKGDRTVCSPKKFGEVYELVEKKKRREERQ